MTQASPFKPPFEVVIQRTGKRFILRDAGCREIFASDVLGECEALCDRLNATPSAQSQAAGEWVLVPREPTLEMQEAGIDSLDGDNHDVEASYRAMIALAAAPSAPQPFDWWNEKERAAIHALMKDRDLSERALMRVALGYYQEAMTRLDAGETCKWSGDAQRARDFSGDLAPQPEASGTVRGDTVALVKALARRLFDADHPHVSSKPLGHGNDWDSHTNKRDGTYDAAQRRYIDLASAAVSMLATDVQAIIHAGARPGLTSEERDIFDQATWLESRSVSGMCIKELRAVIARLTQEPK